LPAAPLTPALFHHALAVLAEADADLAAIHTRLGPPPFWTREPGFPTFVHIILEQQVSLASAQAAFDRLRAVANPLTPERFLELDDATLRNIGFSRQKLDYCRLLARALIAGELDLIALHEMPDAAVRDQLLQRKGIGPWTADVYLLMALRRSDIWPIGDRALVVAVREVKGLPHDPTPVEMEMFGTAWQPWRAVAARLLWHHYLNTPRVRE